MSRTISDANLTQSLASTIRPVLFFIGEFASGNLYIWNGIGQCTWGGNTFEGVGDFGTVSEISETSEIRANGVTVQLSGIPSSMISIALDGVRWGKPVSIYLGFLDSSDALVDTPLLAFRGIMDSPTIDEGSVTATIRISVENRLVDLERSRERRYTDEDQQQLYSGDKGCEFVPSLQDKQVIWGRT